MINAAWKPLLTAYLALLRHELPQSEPRAKEPVAPVLLRLVHSALALVPCDNAIKIPSGITLPGLLALLKNHLLANGAVSSSALLDDASELARQLAGTPQERAWELPAVLELASPDDAACIPLGYEAYALDRLVLQETTETPGTIFRIIRQAFNWRKIRVSYSAPFVPFALAYFAYELRLLVSSDRPHLSLFYSWVRWVSVEQALFWKEKLERLAGRPITCAQAALELREFMALFPGLVSRVQCHFGRLMQPETPDDERMADLLRESLLSILRVCQAPISQDLEADLPGLPGSADHECVERMSYVRDPDAEEEVQEESWSLFLCAFARFLPAFIQYCLQNHEQGE